jgi:hypothetical protein
MEVDHVEIQINVENWQKFPISADPGFQICDRNNVTSKSFEKLNCLKSRHFHWQSPGVGCGSPDSRETFMKTAHFNLSPSTCVNHLHSFEHVEFRWENISRLTTLEENLWNFPIFEKGDGNTFKKQAKALHRWSPTVEHVNTVSCRYLQLSMLSFYLSGSR